MNSTALWATVILVITLPETTSRAHIVVADTASACTEVPRRNGNPWHHPEHGLGTVEGLHLSSSRQHR
uniref:hypothetical protein n=1 Tax=Ferrimicrobium acidiphilum TaxID=121039 RepID=UPI0023F1E9C2